MSRFFLVGEKTGQSLGVSDDSTALLDESDGDVTHISKTRCKAWQSSHILLLLLSWTITLAMASIMILKFASALSPEFQTCLAATSAYSPLLNAVRVSSFNFDNQFDHESEYRGTPTNELERSWERLWNHGLISIPERDFARLNRSRENSYVRTGDGGYAANIEMFHGLHCLSLVRQYTWRDYYRSRPHQVDTPIDLAQATDAQARFHVDHCIETLRISLMCTADVTPFLYLYGYPDDLLHLGRSDFNSNHQCRDFHHIKQEFLNRVVQDRWPGPSGGRQWTAGEP